MSKKFNKMAKAYERKQSKEEKKKQQKQKTKNAKEFSKLLLEKDNLNDLKYFNQELDIPEQDALIKELKEINSVSTVDKPYRIILLEANIPQTFKISALKKISMMENIQKFM